MVLGIDSVVGLPPPQANVKPYKRAGGVWASSPLPEQGIKGRHLPDANILLLKLPNSRTVRQQTPSHYQQPSFKKYVIAAQNGARCVNIALFYRISNVHNSLSLFYSLGLPI